MAQYVESLGETPPKRVEAVKEIARDTAKIFEQRRKWPNSCIRCGGDGGVSGFEDTVNEDEIDEDLCPSCLGIGKCPRCKADLPLGWEDKIDALYDAIEDGKEPPPPVKCSQCKWEDGDPPVMDLQEG